MSSRKTVNSNISTSPFTTLSIIKTDKTCYDENQIIAGFICFYFMFPVFFIMFYKCLLTLIINSYIIELANANIILRILKGLQKTKKELNCAKSLVDKLF